MVGVTSVDKAELDCRMGFVRGIDWVTCHDIFIYVPDSELVLSDEHGRPVKVGALLRRTPKEGARLKVR